MTPTQREAFEALRQARTWVADAEKQLRRGDRIDTLDSIRIARRALVSAESRIQGSLHPAQLVDTKGGGR